MQLLVRWKDVRKRRDWLDKYAKERGFDPLIAENWFEYTSEAVSIAQVLSCYFLSLSCVLLTENQGGETVLSYYSGSVVGALQHLYPEVNFDPNKFPSKAFSSYCPWS